MLRELKKAHCFQSEKRRALTKLEQELFLNFMKTHPVYEHWYPVFSVMILMTTWNDFMNQRQKRVRRSLLRMALWQRNSSMQK